MDFTRQQRKELDALSKEVFGKTSFWYNKLWKTGTRKLADVVAKNPQASHWRYFHTHDEIRDYILTIQKNSKELLEKMKVETSANDLSK